MTAPSRFDSSPSLPLIVNEEPLFDHNFYNVHLGQSGQSPEPQTRPISSDDFDTSTLNDDQRYLYMEQTLRQQSG